MHTLHYIAVEADSAQEAFETVQIALDKSEGATFADWSDWHVVGGGRWNSSNSQYDDNPSDVISLKDNPEQFNLTLANVRKWRCNEVRDLMDRINTDKLISDCVDYISENGQLGQGRFDMNLYYIEKITKMLSETYNCDSFFYDLSEYTGSFEYLVSRITSNPSRQYLVPVDFHF